MKKETKDTILFYSSMVFVCGFTVLAVVVWYTVWACRAIKRFFKIREKTI